MSALSRRVMFLIRRDGGLTLSDLSEQTGAPVKAVQAAAWALVRQHLLDVCWPYFVLPPMPARGAP